MKTNTLLLLLFGGAAIFFLSRRNSYAITAPGSMPAALPNTGTATQPTSPLSGPAAQIIRANQDAAAIGTAVGQGLTGLSNLVSSIGGLFKRPTYAAPEPVISRASYGSGWTSGSLNPAENISHPDWQPNWEFAG